jgi:xanthine dehydrogenase accessory factor
MNISLLKQLERAGNGFVATVLDTEGHTYKKRGARALFVPDRPAPVWGNLGSLCVDQELTAAGAEARAEEKPRLIEIDTSASRDIDFGYGTFCGGRMTILVEPVLISHRAVYSVVRDRLQRREVCYVAHDVDTGDLEVSDTEPQPRGRVFVEEIRPPRLLYIFGATPLTRRVIHHLDGMDFEIHVLDWRPAHLEALAGIDGVACHTVDVDFDASGFVLVQSHDFRRDKAQLVRALAAGCPYVGMLSSSRRRDEMYRELREAGVAGADIDRISSPVGIDLKAKTDFEIAVSIVAELVKEAHE